ncbi:hypothetical protein GCM10010206_67540 [Streptomyces cinerochromogenes]|nr:hypothetical protein GCM10010206_67540 [Streptomyces cinerochromogenes]
MNSRNLAPRVSRLSDVVSITAQRGESYPTRSVCGRGAETEQTSRSACTAPLKCPHMRKGRTRY